MEWIDMDEYKDDWMRLYGFITRPDVKEIMKVEIEKDCEEFEFLQRLLKRWEKNTGNTAYTTADAMVTYDEIGENCFSDKFVMIGRKDGKKWDLRNYYFLDTSYLIEDD